ncbi:hypothetical protein WK00_32245 [Burkholderia ubonensis]|nr:hypothetical protein WK00_32245 [Burkholderia ubonensis]
MRAGNQHRANRGAAQARSGSFDGSDPANRIARTPARPAVRTRLDRRLLGTATRMNRCAASRAARAWRAARSRGSNRCAWPASV